MNRIFSLLCLAAITGCAHKPAPSIHHRALASVAGQVYLKTTDHASPAHDRLLAAASGKHQASAQEIAGWMGKYEESPQYKALIERYSVDLYRLLAIDPEAAGAWIKANAKFYKGISNYVGRSDESMADETPSWQSINGKLRRKEALDAEDKKFLGEILSSLQQLPRVEGLAFRGMSFTKEKFAALAVGQVWHQAAFTSTSLSPSVAASFGAGFEGHSFTGVLILKIKTGYPVSPLTFDHGAQGQPGRFGEYELLLPPGKELFVHAKLEDKAAKTYYIFAEER